MSRPTIKRHVPGTGKGLQLSVVPKPKTTISTVPPTLNLSLSSRDNAEPTTGVTSLARAADLMQRNASRWVEEALRDVGASRRPPPAIATLAYHGEEYSWSPAISPTFMETTYDVRTRAHILHFRIDNVEALVMESCEIDSLLFTIPALGYRNILTIPPVFVTAGNAFVCNADVEVTVTF